MTDYAKLRVREAHGSHTTEAARRKIDGRQIDAKGIAMLRRYYKEIGRHDLAAAIVPPNRRNK